MQIAQILPGQSTDPEVRLTDPGNSMQHAQVRRYTNIYLKIRLNIHSTDPKVQSTEFLQRLLFEKIRLFMKSYEPLRKDLDVIL